jgi:hypothetical protein
VIGSNIRKLAKLWLADYANSSTLGMVRRFSNLTVGDFPKRDDHFSVVGIN